MIKTKKQMLAIIGVFTLVLFLGGVTYAFFSYTRTGGANTIAVGSINFDAQQTTINLTNAFPIARNSAATDTTNTDDVVINITGNTTYSGGIEYLITATGVENTVSSKTVPISIIVTADSDIGTADDEYFDHRGGNSLIYKVLAGDTVENNEKLLVGYIPSGANGVDGNVTIRAFFDRENIAISNTYDETNGVSDNMGTTSTWVGDRVHLTTTEWNNLSVSFKVKVEAQDDTWVPVPPATVNAMNTFPSTITDQKDNIKEVYFNKMGATRMQSAYDAATIKADLTYNNEGKVLAWLETNTSDPTKYNLIVASDGDTYLTTGNNMFQYWQNLIKIEFNNIDTSRVTDMYRMFCMSQQLNEIIGLALFDTSNVTNMTQMFYYCSALTELDLSSFNISSVGIYAYENMFYYNLLLEKIYVSNLWNISNLSSGPIMFYNCPKLVGGNGTAAEANTDYRYEYAIIDGTNGQPGFLTDIADKPTN